MSEVVSKKLSDVVHELACVALAYYRLAMEIYEKHNGIGTPGGKLLIATQNIQPPWGVEQNFHGEVQGGMRELMEIFEYEVERVVDQIVNNRKIIPTFTDVLGK